MRKRPGEVGTTMMNDCERTATKRLLDDLLREHPHMKADIVEDPLAPNGPHVTLLKEQGFRFILGAKPGDHEPLFSWHHRITCSLSYHNGVRIRNTINCQDVPKSENCFQIRMLCLLPGRFGNV